jgi:hypothetical protein
MSKIRIKGDTSGYVDLETSATGSNLSVTGNAVHVPGHVIQTVYDDFTTPVLTTSTSFVDTGVQATITPKFSSSKILIHVSQALSMVGPNSNQYQANLVITDSSNNVLFGTDSWDQFRIKDQIAFSWQASLQYRHSPNTTNAFTYKIRMKSQYGTGNNVNAQYTNAMSSITLMEIAV